MRPKLLLVVLAVLLCSNLWAQSRTRDFSLILPAQKIENSHYKNLKYLDSRRDTRSMGIVQEGAFDKTAIVLPRIPMDVQLQGIMDALTDSTAKDGELLFQTRHLRFTEMAGPAKEYGYCYLRASLYARTGERYRYIACIDTVVKVKSMHVTNTLLKKTSKVLTDFIASGLLMVPVDTNTYSLKDIRNMTDIEKRKTRLYTARAYTNGVYLTYESFKDQAPDRQAIVEMDDKKVHAIKLVDEKGRTEKVDPKDIYAIVHEGQPFIATEYGYYQIRKKNNDFFFFGKARAGVTASETISAGYLQGVVEGQMISQQQTQYEMKIDHFNGAFIPVRNMGIRPE